MDTDLPKCKGEVQKRSINEKKGTPRHPAEEKGLL